MRNAWPIVRETRKGWDSLKLDGYDRFLMERDMMNKRMWLGRRPCLRPMSWRGWAEDFRWNRGKRQ
jgi:hypothetical protein